MADPQGRAPLPWETPAVPPPSRPKVEPPTPSGLPGGGARAPTDGTHERALLKCRIHRRLLERLNLATLDKLEREQVTDAIRRVVHDLLSSEKVPLNSRSARSSSGRCWTRSSAWGRSSR
jgi:pilus assembly protein CpaF